MTDSSGASRPETLEQWAGPARADQARKLTQLTVLFTDIIGSTAICNDLGDKRWIEMLINHFASARRLLQRFDCYEIKIIGDSFMVAFKNAVDALQFASAFLHDTGDEQIKIRAGIHAGAARIIGNDLYGGMVNYASRVMSWHREEGIALSDNAKDQVENEEGAAEARKLFIRVSHKFPDYEDDKILWRVNCSDYWDRRIRQDFPTLEELSKIEGKLNYVVSAATAEDIPWIAEIEAVAYTEDAVPLHRLQKWHAQNPDGFSIVKTNSGHKVGHFDILPLRPGPLQSLLEGEIAESNLEPDTLYAPSEKALIKDLYIESIIIAEPDHSSRSSAIHAVLSNFQPLVRRMCDPTKLENVYAMAATTEGERFMRQIGFQQVRDGSERLDHHPFFAARYDDIAVNINNILGR